MLQTAYTQSKLNAGAALDAFPLEIWTLSISTFLEVAEILPMRAVSREWKEHMTHDDVWLAKLTALTLQVPALTELDQGPEESAFEWYRRCQRSVGSVQDLAVRHLKGEFPFLQLHGCITGNTFTPFGTLRLPLEWGVIAELIMLQARAGAAHPPFDAALLLDGVSAHSICTTFTHIASTLKEARRRASATDLRQLPELLSRRFCPQPRQELAGSSSAEPLPPVSPVAVLPVARAAAQTAGGEKGLKLRLKRMGGELQRANARIAQLELENSRLRRENTELRAENRELRAENARLTGRAQAAERERDKTEAERDKLKRQLDHAHEQLTAQRRARASLARQLDAMTAERDTLRLLLSAAERAFEKAEAMLIRERDSVGAAQRRALEAERNAAAQVAAAQLSATEAIEDAVQARVQERGLMTMSEFVDYSQLEAAVGMVSPPFRRVAAHVMAAECSSADSSTTLPSTSTDGRGRGVTYVRVVRALKPSDELSSRQLWERTQHLRASLTQVSYSSPDPPTVVDALGQHTPLAITIYSLHCR